MDFKQRRNRALNPSAHANPISKILFLWMLPIFKEGYKKELDIEDLYDILEEDETQRLGNQLETYWEHELEKAKLTGKKPSLLRAVIRMSWKTFAVAGVVYTINQCVINVVQPIFLRLLIVQFTEGRSNESEAYLYAAGVSLCVFLNTLTIHPGAFQMFYVAMKLRVACSTLIYRKSLRLSKSAQNKTSAGQIWPFQFGILMYILWDQIGPASVVGVMVVLILLPMQYYIGKYSAVFRMKIAKRTDERGRFMNEIIVGMRVIKQYAWEKPFSLLIAGCRKLEVVELRKRAVLRGIHAGLIHCAPKLVQYLTFLAFVLIEDEPMTADKVFFTLACLHTVMRITIHFMPMAAAGVGETLVSVKRIQEFLLLDEQATNNTQPRQIIGRVDKNETGVDEVIEISMLDVCASWTSEKLTLDNISFSIRGEKLLMIVGPVGSSKTSLLHTIIDELPISSGKLNIQGAVSYASQDPWIFAGNLRQNIIFGLPYDEIRYKETLKVCALEEDLRQLPYGDSSVVGERGVALSGGQKARVNLARAIYREADIYLLDDPLSAVDTAVSRHLFEKCVKEHLGGTIRILVTHQLQYLPHADHVLVLNQGKVLAQGTYDELMEAGIDFVGLMSNESDEAKRKHSTHELTKTVEKQVEKAKPMENTEKKLVGSVTAKTYWEYFTSGHSMFTFFVLTSIFIICQLFISANDYWLSYWTNAEQRRYDLENNVTVCIDPDDKACDDTYLGENVYLYTYTGLAVAVTATALIRGWWFYLYCCTISVNIHDRMFRSMVRAPTKFYDENPSGRIMNRFTNDVGAMDEMLPLAFMDTLAIFLQVIGVMCVVIISNYYMGVPTVLLFVALFAMRKFFIQTARDVKRIESLTRSPVFTHVTATIQGLTTIRASKSQHVLIEQFEGHQDIHTSSWYIFLGANRWFGIWLELISDFFFFLVAFSFLLVSSSDQGGNVGLAIASLLSVMGSFQWGMRQSAETENYMTSVERALEYSKLESEADLESKPGADPTLEWPDLGQVEFHRVTLSYEIGKPVLKNLSFKIKPREKIGIVGRTGAGKSSVISALFRMTEPEGDIIIDKIPIKNIGLHDLRKKISIIPQDPVLFSGTVRYNLDPFSQFDDQHLWKVIEEVELKEQVTSLDFHVDDGGTNFSVGQRQLVCLARAILRKNKILVMDEATANVDPRTDQLIQQTIRSKFSDCTIITIAHRLHSIIDCDRILVLDHGSLKEYDQPHILLQSESGIFTGMVAQTGKSTSAMLRQLAEEAFRNKSPSIHKNDT